MYVARILYPIRVLGPGNRIGIWFNGCHHRCPGCSNPELWEPQEKYQVSLQSLLHLIRSICAEHPVDGFTLTGGDPFAQPEALRQLLPALKALTSDILIYTGYCYETLALQYPDLLDDTGVLIDGPYLQERNNGAILRGSDNQNILILNEQLQPRYQAYLADATNEIQNFTTLDGVISVGIHHPGYEARIDALLKQKGLEDYA